MPDGLLFDLDGTLVDTVGTRVEAWLAVFRERGIPAERGALGLLIGSDGRVVAQETARVAGRELTPDEAEAIDARAGALFGERNTDPRPLPGAAELLAHLDALGLPWAVATSSRPEQVAASIGALGLERPATVTDGSRVTRAKPEPDLLLEAARQLGLEPGRVWYVGDATWDMRAAVAAGMPAVGVTSGAADSEALETAGASAVVTDLAEVRVLLDEVLPPEAGPRRLPRRSPA